MRSVLPGFLSMVFLCCLVGCTIADYSTPLPDGFFIEDDAVSSDRIPTTKDGGYNKKEALSLLGSVRPLIVSTANNAIRYPSRIQVSVEGTSANQLTVHGRQYYSLEAGFELARILSGSTSVKAKYLLEWHLRDRDPQFKLTHRVTASDIAKLVRHLRSEESGYQALLFSRHIYAPGLLVLHELQDARADFSFPVLFKANANWFKDLKWTWSRCLYVRRYENSEIVGEILSKRDPMIQEAGESESVSHGPAVPPNDAVFELGRTKYRFTKLYAAHLTAEGVMLSIPEGGSMSSYDPTLEEFGQVNCTNLTTSESR